MKNGRGPPSKTPPLISGLEALEVLVALLGPKNDIRGRSATFYIDNNNALSGIVKNSATPVAIQAMVGSKMAPYPGSPDNRIVCARFFEKQHFGPPHQERWRNTRTSARAPSHKENT